MAHIDIIEGASDERIADWLAGRLQAELAANAAPVAITVPGGSTPFPILAALARYPLDWRRGPRTAASPNRARPASSG